MSSKFPQVPGYSLRTSSAGPLAFTIEALKDERVACAASLSLIDRGHEWRATATLTEAPETAEAGLAVIRWAEAQARTIVERFRARLQRAGRAGSVNIVFCLDNPPGDATTAEAMAAAGLELAVAEDEMTRPTADAPSRPLQAGMEMRAWDESTAPLFYHAYFESFRERPGFPNWEESRWRSAFASDEAFRPDLSRVVVDGPEPAAFAVLWVEEGVGWITQMGVRKEWRGCGLGEALLSHALRAFAAEGLETAALEVATNNPAARALYARAGFGVGASYRSWRKVL